MKAEKKIDKDKSDQRPRHTLAVLFWAFVLGAAVVTLIYFGDMPHHDYYFIFFLTCCGMRWALEVNDADILFGGRISTFHYIKKRMNDDKTRREQFFEMSIRLMDLGLEVVVLGCIAFITLVVIEIETGDVPVHHDENEVDHYVRKNTAYALGLALIVTLGAKHFLGFMKRVMTFAAIVWLIYLAVYPHVDFGDTAAFYINSTLRIVSVAAILAFTSLHMDPVQLETPTGSTLQDSVLIVWCICFYCLVLSTTVIAPIIFIAVDWDALLAEEANLPYLLYLWLTLALTVTRFFYLYATSRKTNYVFPCLSRELDDKEPDELQKEQQDDYFGPTKSQAAHVQLKQSTRVDNRHPFVRA